MSSRRSPTSALSARRIRSISCRSAASSSRTRLLAGTAASGSIYTVAPLAEVSCTMPGKPPWCSCFTGTTCRPERSVMRASCSTPRAAGDRSCCCMIACTAAVACRNRRRSDCSSGEAVSATRPCSSNVPSMREPRSGWSASGATMRQSAGVSAWWVSTVRRVRRTARSCAATACRSVGLSRDPRAAASAAARTSCAPPTLNPGASPSSQRAWAVAASRARASAWLVVGRKARTCSSPGSNPAKALACARISGSSRRSADRSDASINASGGPRGRTAAGGADGSRSG